MPEVTVDIGGRRFDVACQEGEEQYLRAAAKLLDTEAQSIVRQIGRMPEGRLLLMAGLMVADRVAGLDDQLRAETRKVKALTAELEALNARPAPKPERVEVPVLPRAVTESLAGMAARTEALAAALAERLPHRAEEPPPEA